MRNIKVERKVAAAQSSVWAVLADYPNIVDWNDNMKNSYSIGEQTEGVGAQRQTELIPDGAMRMRETVTEWVPDDKMVIAMDQIEQMPVTEATQTFTLSRDGDTTSVTMSYDYEPMGEWLGQAFDDQMAMGFNRFIDGLERAAQARTAT